MYHRNPRSTVAHHSSGGTPLKCEMDAHTVRVSRRQVCGSVASGHATGRSRNSGFCRGGTALVLLLTVAACDRSAVPSDPAPTPLVASYVTGAAALALQSNGTFVSDSPESPDGTPMISEKRAGQLALAYVRSFGRSFHANWERQRGSSIDLTMLSVGRTYFAHSPYGAFPKGFHPAMRRTYGPWYLVTLESNGTPVIIMAVSAYNTDVGIDATGNIVLPKLGGMEFIHGGIPTTASIYAPMSPEEAVKKAFDAGHTQITEPPQLVLPGRPKSPLLAVWELKLAHDIPSRAQNEQASHASHLILVGPREKDRFQRPDENQPASAVDRGPTVNASGAVGAAEQFEVPVRSGRTVKATPVTLGAE
jgi:hypothetical protein